MGVGASFAGGIPFVSVDHNGLSCSHLTANHHGEILQLDLTLPESARIIHMKFGASPGTVFLGSHVNLIQHKAASWVAWMIGLRFSGMG